LLAGRLTRQTHFLPDDHRAFNRHGEAFDRGETFSGLDYELGLELTGTLKTLVPEGTPMSAWVMRWILMNDAVTCVIPGAKRPEQVEQNALAAELPPLSESTLAQVRHLYDERVRHLVHQRW
jgi:aryl-alcohol dehydrogenase-like predicted oxidoreductase